MRSSAAPGTWCCCSSGGAAIHTVAGGRCPEVDEGFVQGKRFHHRCQAVEQIHDLATCDAVGTEPTSKECCMRTPSPCLVSRHGRPYAENACLVRGGGNDSALAQTAHNDGLAA